MILLNHVIQTHNVAMVSPIADFVVDMGSDGRIVSQGTLSNALAHDAKLLKELRHEQEEMEKAKQELDQETPEDENAKQAAGKLIVEEETELGHVGWDSSTLTYIWPWNGVDVMLAFSVAFHRKRGEAAFPLLGRLHRTLRHPSPHHQCPGNFQYPKCYIL